MPRVVDRGSQSKAFFLLLLHPTVSSFVRLRFCPSPPPTSQSQPPPRHRSLLLQLLYRHIIPHHRSFCHYSRAHYKIKSTVCPQRTHAARALIRPRAPSPPHRTHASTSSPVSLSSLATDSTLVFIERTSLTSQPRYHHHTRPHREELAPSPRDPPSTSHLNKSFTRPNKEPAPTLHQRCIYRQSAYPPCRSASTSFFKDHTFLIS